MNSQSALRAEADSGDDSELSLSLFEKVQNEPVSFGLYEKCTSLTHLMARSKNGPLKMVHSKKIHSEMVRFLIQNGPKIQ